jgi:hypothetical protein
MGMRLPNFHYSANPHDISAQIDLIGMSWLMIREDPSAAPIGGSAGAPMVTRCNFDCPCAQASGQLG